MSAKHSPLPWKVRDEIGDYIIEDANGKPVANPRGRDNDRRLENAEFIVEAANNRYRLQNLLDLTFSFVAGWTFAVEERLKNEKDAEQWQKDEWKHKSKLGRSLMAEIENECGGAE